MNAKQERRWGKLKISLLALPFYIMGSLALAPVTVLRPVLDSDGHQVFREDGRRMLETDHWGDFKVNWIGYSLLYAGIGVVLWGVGGWIYEGFSGRKEEKTISKVD